MIECLIEYHNILNARNWNRKHWETSNSHNFSRECPTGAYDISKHSIKIGSPRKIETTTTFDWDSWLGSIIYRNTWNQTRKPWEISNGHNFWLGCPIDSQNISQCSKLNKEVLGKLKWPYPLTRMLDWGS